MTKNVLVTGCAGFIGFNLSKTLLKENHNVYGVDSLNSAYDKKFKELRLQKLETESNFHFINNDLEFKYTQDWNGSGPVSYTHLRAHETPEPRV